MKLLHLGTLWAPVHKFAALAAYLAWTCNPAFAIPIFDIDTQSGFIGTNADDTIFGLGLLDVLAEADALGIDFPLFGSGVFDSSVTAVAQASGADALAGEDSVDIADPITTTATATATGAAADGSLAGDASADISVNAVADSSGVDGGDDDDEIINSDAISADSSTQATAVSATLTLDGGVTNTGDQGDALVEAGTTSEAAVLVIAGGAGADRIDNTGQLSATADANATAVSASFDITISDGSDVAAGAALSDGSSVAAANILGIGAGEDADWISNSGDIDLTATASAVGVAFSLDVAGSVNGDATSGGALSDTRTEAATTAVGIDGGSGNDTILSATRINAIAESTATAVSTGFSVAVSKDVDVTAGAAVSDASSLASTRAIGIDGGADDDSIGGEEGITGGIVLHADSIATGVAASFSVAGSVAGDPTAGDALSEARSDANAETKAIVGGGGGDVILSATAIDATATATATAVSAGFSVEVTKGGDAEGEVSGAAALSDASSLAASRSIGIDGGEGDNTITSIAKNDDIIDLTAESTATGVSASVTVSGQLQGDVATGGALSEASTTAAAAASAIESGGGNDTITNATDVIATTDATATGVSVGVFVGITGDGDITNTEAEAAGAALSDASSVANATSTGISSGDGVDDVWNSGELGLLASSHATGVAVSLSVAGSASGDVGGGAVSDASVVAESYVTGIDGGDGRDSIFNQGAIHLMDEEVGAADADADAIATAVAVSLAVSGSLDGDVSGEALSDASATAVAFATGIAGGAGIDSIENWGRIIADVGAETTTVAVSVEASITKDGNASGASLSDSSATALAAASGIDGGDDGDDIDNRADIDITTDAESDSVSVSVTLAGSMGGVASGEAMANASADSIARSVGITGGGGDDDIDTADESFDVNELSIHTHSRSDAAATAVSVTLAGAVGAANGAAVADASATGESFSTGIDGGSGEDVINNTSAVAATAEADATASSTTVTVTISAGAADSVGTGDSGATAKAATAGIDGGDDGDTITNAATIYAGASGNTPMAQATAGSTTVSVGVTVGAAESEASANAAALAEASASGISGGSGGDEIFNSGAITVGIATEPDDSTQALALARAGSQTVDIGITLGESFRDASSDSSATALSDMTGIAGGAGTDIIDHTGTIDTFSSATAESDSKTTQVSLILGTSEGGATADATSRSTAIGTGIDGGLDADQITITGGLTVLTVEARSVAETKGTSMNLELAALGDSNQSAEANSSSTAEAIARGVYGDTGNDTITVAGVFTITADSDVLSSSRSSTLGGLSAGASMKLARSQAETTADSLAIGIDGDAGDDTITSTATLDLNAFADALTSAVSSTNSGLNIAGASSVESVADAATTVTATAIGIRGGAAEPNAGETDVDVITSDGPISINSTVTATTDSTSTADSLTLFGSAEGKAVSDASAHVAATALGIITGADDDTITSSDSLEVTASATGSVTSTSNVDADAIFGDASSKGASNASANVTASALAIDGGSGADTINSRDILTVTAMSSGSVTATSNVNADVTFGSASSGAVSDASAFRLADAMGITGGDGVDTITNYAALMVKAVSDGSVFSKAHANADATFGSTSSSTVTAAAIEGTASTVGITGGSEDDTISNPGTIDSIALATLHVTNSSVSIADSTFGDAFAAAASVSSAQGKADATGISGDAGNDWIENSGGVNSIATSTTTVDAVTVALADSTFGSARTVARSDNFAAGEVSARGITAGGGNDVIRNTELVTVVADNSVTVKSLTVSGSGPASSNAETRALAQVVGADGGAGADMINNLDTIFVKAAPRILSANRTFGSRGNVDGKVNILLDAVATGVSGGAGDDVINNTGDVLAFIGGPESDSMVSLDAVVGAVTVTDDSFIPSAPTAPQALAGKWMRFSTEGNSDFFTQVVSFDSMTGTFTLSDPLPYDLPTGSAYALYDYGDKQDDITSVVVTAGGNSFVDASTTASVRAQGIAGGEGDDQLSNSGAVAVSASNRVKAVTVTIARNIVADTRVESSVNAVGIAGNEQSDTSDRSAAGSSVFADLSRKGDDPEALIGLQVVFESGASAGFSSLVSGFDPDTGTFILADPLPSGGLTRGDNYSLGGGSDIITNLGAIDVAANGAINASGWSLAFGVADIQAGGRVQAAAAGIQGGGFVGDFLENKDYIKTRSNAEVTSIERVIATFGTVEQKLGFSSSSNAAGMLAGSGDDSIMNSAQAVTDVNAASTTSIQGITSSTTIYSIGQQTVNLVDALAEARATGVELGAGENIASNDGVLIVHASAVPATLGGPGADECAPYTCLAKAVSDTIYDPIFNIFYDESSASANATATAIAHGIHGEGKDQVFNNGNIQVSSEVIATSFAQASEVIPAEDQSTVTTLIPGDKDQFRDKSVQGISATELVGRRLRFPEHPDLDFLNNVSSISEVTGSNTFEDSTFIGVGDPESLVGNRVRFPVLNNPDFLTFVEAFDSTTGEFVLADDIPTDSNGNPLVMNGDAYTLSILSTEVLAFDPEASKFTLGNEIPGEVSKGNAYTLSIVSAKVPSGSTTFTDVTRTDSVAAGTRITFTGIPGFEAFVVGFDPSTGTFLLDRAITATLPKDEVYELSGDSDGSSGSSASAFATGIDLGNGDARVETSGVIEVTATATAQAGVEALLGNENASAVSIAEARGIRTRDGNDWIMNSGKIDVHADVVAQSSTVDFSGRALVIGIYSGAGSDTVINTGEIKVTGMVEAADAIFEAIGADTGDGDDIVLNAGTGSVSASTTIAGITTTATAISTGVGQDQVSLLDQSGITGRIDLGPGDDLLTLAGGATVAGAVTGSEGSDTVRLEDRGSFFLPELQENEHYQVDQGTLEVAADMVIPADGSFRAEIYNPGVAEPGFGQIVVDGVANLGGVANVSALPRIFADGEDFPLLMAGQFNNGFPAFDTVNLPPDSALVNFGHDYRFDVAGRDLFEVTTAVEPFRTVARNSLQRTVAGYLERIAPTASGDLAEVIGTFQLLPQNANFDTAFTSLSPDTHDNYTQATFFGVSQYQETLSRRLRARRIDKVLGGTSSRQAGFETDRSLLLAYSGDNSGIRSLYAGEVTEVPAWWRDVWVTAFGQWGDQDGEDGYTGFDYNVLGLSVGIDHPVNDRLLLGASAAYTDTDVDQENGRGDGDIEGWMASLYSSYSLDSAYVDATLSYGQNDYDAKRKIRIGDLARSAKSDHDGDVIAVSLGGGYLVSRDSVVLEPFGRLQYIKLDEDSFTESGAGDINQRISSRDTDSLTSEIGMRISRSFPHASGRLTTDASVAWLHDFDIDDRTITTSYTGAPTSSFSLPGQDVESNGVTLGLGVAFETRKRVSTSLNYNGEFRDGFSAHGISGRISYRF